MINKLSICFNALKDSVIKCIVSKPARAKISQAADIGQVKEVADINSKGNF